jgi:hypothetical protein
MSAMDSCRARPSRWPNLTSRAGKTRRRGRWHDRPVNVKRSAEIALRERLESLGVPLDGDGRAEHLRQVVVDTVDDASLGQALADLREGSGGELTATDAHRPKFHSAFSSSALAVNVFGPWRLDPGDLAVESISGFTTLRFEAQRAIFRSRATPPNLDVLLETEGEVLAIESKLTEYLTGNERASFADRYVEAVEELADPSWAAVYRLLSDEPARFAFLNADQLVKHYLGLKRTQQSDPRPVMLLYLYWEPPNANGPAFVDHRREIAEFTGLVDDPAVRFSARSYPELWQQWEQGSTNERVAEHLERLRERYGATLAL